MTASAVRTKAEIETAEHAASVVRRLPDDVAGDIKRVRGEAAARVATHGLPGRQIEEWKFTDVRVLMQQQASARAVAGARTRELAAGASSAGELSVGESSVGLWAGGDSGMGADKISMHGGGLLRLPPTLPRGVTVRSISDASHASGGIDVADAPLSIDEGARRVLALNTAMHHDGLLIEIAPGAQLERPLHIACSSDQPAALRHRIVVGAGASATIIESNDLSNPHAALRPDTGVTSIVVGEGATLEHVLVDGVPFRSTRLSCSFATLAAGATLRGRVLALGHGISRLQPFVTFTGEGATYDLAAVLLASPGSHHDLTLVADHAVPRCTSRELVKAVIGEEARAVFQGKVIVRPGAQKTDGKQMAKALMLAPSAEFDSKPELEIYADDVVCGHGATVAELDDDLLFYCRARGIPLAQARVLLIESFIGEAIDKIGNEAIRHALSEIALEWLRK